MNESQTNSHIRIATAQRMDLYEKIKSSVFDKYKTFKLVGVYFEHYFEKVWNSHMNEFEPGYIIKQREKYGELEWVIDVELSLPILSDEKILQIAIDLDIEVPNVLYTLPIIDNVLLDPGLNYNKAYQSFEKALKSVFTDPQNSLALANTTLETIIKHILEQNKLKIEYKKNDTLYELAENILSGFSIYPNSELQVNIKKIASSILNISRNIEALRSDKTLAHGKGINDILINDPYSASFALNCISTLGLFFISTYEKCFNSKDIIKNNKKDEYDDVPF